MPSRMASLSKRVCIMASSNLMSFLIGMYILTAAVALWEGNYLRVMYWGAASVLTLAVLLMGQR